MKQVTRKFGSEVVRVRYHFGEDWDGDLGVFFRVLLTDEACSDEDRFRAVTLGIRGILSGPCRKESGN